MHLHQYLSGVYQGPRPDALHLHTLYIRVGRMNKYKEEWMEHANALIPKTIKLNSQTNELEMAWDMDAGKMVDLHQAGMKTTRAIAMGVAISAIDGPLPVMDVVGFGVATGMAIHAWYEYFS